MKLKGCPSSLKTFCLCKLLGGDRGRGGQRGINTAGFNIRSKDRHFALSCGTCLRIRSNTWRALVNLGCVSIQPGKVARGAAVVTPPHTPCQHSWFSLVVKVPLCAEESMSSLLCKIILNSSCNNENPPAKEKQPFWFKLWESELLFSI
jgi:hypothetical protein